MGLAARRALSVALAMLFGMVALAAVPTPASAAQTCGGVWVVVDYGSLGGTTVSCAASGYGTGTAALRSAGFTPTLDGGFTTKINGKPTTPDTYKEYWSYWHASTNANGTWGAWQYSTLGANSYQPRQGDAEGWRYQSATAGTVSPGTRPPVAPVASPSATQTKTTARPAPTTTEPTTEPSSA